MHFSPDCDQLDDPVILPMPTTLHNVHLLLHVVQLNDFKFFSGDSSFFGRFRLLCNTYRQVTLVRAPREVHGGIGIAVACRWKPHPREGRHEGLWKEKRYLNTQVWKTSEKWRRWNATPLRTEFGPHRKRVANGCVVRMRTTGMWQRSL